MCRVSPHHAQLGALPSNPGWSSAAVFYRGGGPTLAGRRRMPMWWLGFPRHTPCGGPAQALCTPSGPDLSCPLGAVDSFCVAKRCRLTPTYLTRRQKHSHGVSLGGSRNGPTTPRFAGLPAPFGALASPADAVGAFLCDRCRLTRWPDVPGISPHHV